MMIMLLLLLLRGCRKKDHVERITLCLEPKEQEVGGSCMEVAKKKKCAERII